MKEVVLLVDGMMCQKNCGTTVTNALKNTSGVHAAVARFDEGAALVQGTASAEELVDAVEMMGFDAREENDPTQIAILKTKLQGFLCSTTCLEIEGMMCQKNCGTTVYNALKNVQGVEKAVVSFPLASALIQGSAPAAELVDAVEMMGFDARVASAEKSCFLLPKLEEFEKQQQQQGKQQQKNGDLVVVLKVQGMMCQKNCGSTVQRCLSNVEGVNRAIVSYPASAAVVYGSASPSELVDAIECIGFDATQVTDRQEQAALASRVQADFENSSSNSSSSSSSAVVGNSTKHVGALEFEQGAGSSISDDQSSDGDGPKADAPKVSKLRRAEVSISGMTCTACVSNVERNVSKIDGVFRVAVALIAEKATIEYDPSSVGGRDLAHAVDKLGYKATLLEENLPLDAGDQQGVGKLVLEVADLSWRDVGVELAQPLLELDGVMAVSVDDDRGVIKITHVNDQIGARDLYEFVGRSGFACKLAPKDAEMSASDEVARYYRRMFVGSLFFTIPVVFISMVCPHIPWMMVRLSRPTGLGIDWHSLLMWMLSTPVQFLFAARFYRNAYKAVLNGAANMDVLVVLGTSSAYLYSMVSLIVAVARHTESEEAARDAHFFETSAMLITFILMGKYLESSARGRTADAITALMDMQAETAILVPGGPGEDEDLGELRRLSSHGSVNSDISVSSLLGGSLDDDDDDDKDQVNVKKPHKSNHSDDGSCSLPDPPPLPTAENEREIDLRLVQVGDVLKILPGARVPVDGVVTFGHSATDEAMLTGEAEPVQKKKGSSVTGSTMNGHGVLYMRATRVGSDTALAQIMKLVEDAQTSKAPIQEYTDQISRYFVPAVVALACLTWVVWFLVIFVSEQPPEYVRDLGTSDRVVFAFKFGVAVLVISCPCALGLATPTAVMVATGVGASKGILIKGAQAIESGSRVSAVVFDKTGTLTKGAPSVNQVYNASSRMSNEELLQVVATAELASEHPVAKAIVSHARTVPGVRLGHTPSTFEALPGLGIDCRVAGATRVLVGNRKLLKRNRVPLPEKVEQFMQEHEQYGTVVLAAIEQQQLDGGKSLQVVGAIAVCDQLNENASYVVSLLRMMGVKVFMLSGDNETTAHAVAALCGIPPDRVFGNCLPNQKSNRIKALQGVGETVAMVGDGVNDSPALTLADLGIAVGAGTDIAIKSADVVLIRSNLMDVPIFIDLARKSLFRIKLNLFFSFVYNMLCIPLAAGIFYPTLKVRLPPTLAGFMMSLSSVTVVVSSLLLRFYRPPQIMDVEFETSMAEFKKVPATSVPDVIDMPQDQDLMREGETSTRIWTRVLNRGNSYRRIARKESTSSLGSENSGQQQHPLAPISIV